MNPCHFIDPETSALKALQPALRTGPAAGTRRSFAADMPNKSCALKLETARSGVWILFSVSLPTGPFFFRLRRPFLSERSHRFKQIRCRKKVRDSMPPAGSGFCCPPIFTEKILSPCKKNLHSGIFRSRPREGSPFRVHPQMAFYRDFCLGRADWNPRNGPLRQRLKSSVRLERT